jgi:hypothetical protein
MDLLSRDLGAAVEVELLQRLQPRQMRLAQAALDQPLLTFFEFGLQQRRKETEMSPPLTHRLLGEWAALRNRLSHHAHILTTPGDSFRSQRAIRAAGVAKKDAHADDSEAP